MSLKIISLNVSGIRNQKKRDSIFAWLKENNADIVFLQETHCKSENDNKQWSAEWGGQCIWSTCASASRGVAILVKPKIDVILSNSEIDPQGRYIIVDCKVDELQTHLINIYAPNIPQDRINFFILLNKKIRLLEQLTDDRYIVQGGDFNCTQNSFLDRRHDKKIPTHTLNEDRGNKELKSLMMENNLEDVWRRRNPSARRYSYFKANSKIASRIDYWLISETLDSSVLNVTNKAATHTDHYAIILRIKTSICERGKGYWKLSSKLLNTAEFDAMFKALWLSCKRNYIGAASKREWWDKTKSKIKEASIEKAKELSKKTIIEISITERAIEKENHCANPDPERIRVLKSKLESIWNSKSEAARIRSRVQEFENGEKSTMYFFSLEKLHGQSKQWHRIKDVQGITRYGIDNILRIQSTFFENLFKSEGHDIKATEKLTANIDIILDANVAQDCERSATADELKKVVKMLKKNKAPGFDGLTAEFYLKYWDDIKNEFLGVVKEIEECCELCHSQYRGIISLIYKKGDREDIKNWRPITLLNVDYKIIAKLYAERLKAALPLIVHENQRAFIKGRQITENIRQTQDIIEYAEKQNIPGAIIFLDQAKAFDRVEWQYLMECLKSFGFGNNFCNWILMLYKRGESSVLTNGFLSNFFGITRSMRQGCPIAAYLYILQAEPMALAIRKSTNICGIRLPVVEEQRLEARISMFADDTQLFHSTEKSIKEGFDILETYCQASGAKINISKTKGLYIGQWKNKTPVMTNIDWVKTAEGLGAKYGFNINYEELWLQKFCKFKKKIQCWSKRDLTLQGKKILISSFIVSGLSFMIDCYPDNISEYVMKETKNLIKEFLWKGKTWRVAQKTMSLKKNHGGIEIPDIDAIIQARQINWIKKIHFSVVQSWNAIGKHYIASQDGINKCENFILKCSLLNGESLKKLPKFYKLCIEAWSKNLAKRKPYCQEDILKMNIFCNIDIVTKKKQSILFTHWCASGIMTINDIWDQTYGNFKNGIEIVNKLVKKSNWIAEYQIIKKAIPKSWKDTLKSNINIPASDNFLHNPDHLVIDDTKVQLNFKTINPIKLKLKQIYTQCLYPVQIPKCVTSWSGIFAIDITWSDVFTRLATLTYGRKQVEFHWKTVHRAVFTESRLQQMNRSDGICKICKSTRETTIHLLKDCTKLFYVWAQIEKKIAGILKTNYSLSLSDVIFAKSVPNKDHTFVINCFILEAKWQIWKERNRVKFENVQPLTAFKLLEIILNSVKSTLKIFRETSQGNTYDLIIKQILDEI